MSYFYALYHGETPLVIADSIQTIANYLNISVKSAGWLCSASAHKRYEGHNANLVYKYEV